MEKQITNIEVKKNNRNRVFRYICRRETVSNPEIAYHLNLSLPTATQITRELIQEGLVEEKGELQSTGGRRAKALSAAVNSRLALGLDITKNHISLVLVNLAGTVLNHTRLSFPFANEDSYYQYVNEQAKHFLNENGVEHGNVLGIGIAFPGIIDLDREMLAASHILGVQGIPFDEINRFFSYSCRYLNDANAGAYAEGIRGAAKKPFFYLSLSNTVGGAVFHGHELVQGNHFRCGEAGHMTIFPGGAPCYCGKRGCLDAYCRAGLLSEAAGGKLETFFSLLEQGDRSVMKIWDAYIENLAVAVNNIHMVLDCDIVLGGYVGSYLSPYMQEIWEKVAERNTFAEEVPFVRCSKYRTGAAALGAAMEVIENFVQQI